MKNLVLLIVMSICLAACTTSSDKNNSKNVDLVKSYVKAVEDLDFDAMNKYLDDSYIGLGPSFGDSVNKVQAMENWKSNIANLYEKIHYNRSKFASVAIPEGDNKGEWVANWAELTITYKNGIGSVTIWANSDYLVKNGKIVRSFTFYNEADALRQLGYKIVPPEKGE